MWMNTTWAKFLNNFPKPENTPFTGVFLLPCPRPESPKGNKKASSIVNIYGAAPEKTSKTVKEFGIVKKIIILIVALVLLVSTAMAENFSNMTDGELMALYEQVSSEMANRNLLSEAPGDQDEELKDHLYEFMSSWSTNDLTGMLSRCSSEWKTKQEDPSLSLYTILKGRLPVSYEILSISGTNADTVRYVESNIEINWNNGKPYVTYPCVISMVKEADGAWYVDPTSLATDEIPEPTLVPEAAEGVETGADQDIP